jgi:hypothetical protein
MPRKPNIQQLSENAINAFSALLTAIATIQTAPIAAPQAKAEKAPKIAKPEKAPKAKPAKTTKAPKAAGVEERLTDPKRCAIIMGGKTMKAKEVAGLVLQNDLMENRDKFEQYIAVILSSNQGDGKIFERVDKGQYKVQNPAQFKALAKAHGVQLSGKAERVTAKQDDAGDPPNSSDDITDPLEALIEGTDEDEDSN